MAQRTLPRIALVMLTAVLFYGVGCSPPTPVASSPGAPTTPMTTPMADGVSSSGGPVAVATEASDGSNSTSQSAAEPSANPGGESAGLSPPTSAAAGAAEPAEPAANPAEAKGDSTSASADLTPVPIESGVATLSPANTKIIFVGTHAGAKPDPRTGGFEKFSGTVAIDEASKTVKSVVVEIDTNSIWTQFPKLTDHLKSPDFFEVREYPTAKFESTAIEPGEGGMTKIRGNLTLHGVTKEITIPASVQIGGQGLTVSSKFDFNRTDFGIKFATDRVDDKVSMTVVVGEKTQPTGPS